MAKATLHLLMGLPGSGKSTFARELSEVTGSTILNSDEMRKAIFIKPCFSQDEHDQLYGVLDHNLTHLLECGLDVIYDANLNRLHHRQEKYDLAKKYDAKVRLWWVKTDKNLAKKRRVSQQDALLLPDGETSEKMFDRIAEVFEPPGEDENMIIVDGTKITKKYTEKLLSSNQ